MCSSTCIINFSAPRFPSKTSLISLSSRAMSQSWDSQASQNTSRFSLAILLDGWRASVWAAEMIWATERKIVKHLGVKDKILYISKCGHFNQMISTTLSLNMQHVSSWYLKHVPQFISAIKSGHSTAQQHKTCQTEFKTHAVRCTCTHAEHPSPTVLYLIANYPVGHHCITPRQEQTNITNNDTYSTVTDWLTFDLKSRAITAEPCRAWL